MIMTQTRISIGIVPLLRSPGVSRNKRADLFPPGSNLHRGRRDFTSPVTQFCHDYRGLFGSCFAQGAWGSGRDPGLTSSHRGLF